MGYATIFSMTWTNEQLTAIANEEIADKGYPCEVLSVEGNCIKFTNSYGTVDLTLHELGTGRDMPATVVRSTIARYLREKHKEKQQS